MPPQRGPGAPRLAHGPKKLVKRRFTRKQQPRKQDDASAVQEAKKKWLHHRLKVLRKVLKKAKVFEVRKIQRRIAQANDAAAKGPSAASPPAKQQQQQQQQQADVQKLQSQLEAAKAVDLEQVAQRAALRHGLTAEPQPTGPSIGAGDDGATATLGDGAGEAQGAPGGQMQAVGPPQQQVIVSRLLKSGAVKKELADAMAEFSKRFKTVLRAPQEEDEAEDEDEEEEGDVPGPSEEGEEEGAADRSGGDGELGCEEESEGGGEEAATGAAAGGRGVQSLLAKLRAASAGGRGEGSDEEDSGVIDDDDLLDADALKEEGLGRHGGSGEDEGEEDEEVVGSRRGRGGSGDEGSEEGGAREGDGEEEEGSVDSRQWDQPAPGGSEEEEEEEDGEVRQRGEPGTSGQERTQRVAGAVGRSRGAAGERALAGKGAGIKAAGQGGGRKGSGAAAAAEAGGGGPSGGSKASRPGIKDAAPAGEKKSGSKQAAAAAEKPAGAKKKKAYNPKDDDPLRKGGAKQKNRLGQHARRKLAEMKYGREARHFQRLQEEEQKKQGGSGKGTSKGAGDDEKLHPSWAAKRKLHAGALSISPVPASKKIRFDDGEEGGGGGGGSGAGGKRATTAVAAKARPQQKGAPGKTRGPPKSPGHAVPASKAAAADEKLHPSWEARKQQKALAAAMPIGVPKQPTGKKTVFED